MPSSMACRSGPGDRENFANNRPRPRSPLSPSAARARFGYAAHAAHAAHDAHDAGQQRLLLFIAGHETTVNLIGNGTFALLRHPDQLARLQAEPALIGNAVEKLLRYDSPVQRTARITNTDVELDGHPMPKGTMVVTALGAAKRDPAQFADPDRLDVTRRDVRHISSGFGIHFCLGAPLARVEGQIALGTLLRRAPRLKLAETDPEWRESSVLRGLKGLRLTF